MIDECVFCQKLENIKHKNTDPYFVIELKTGYVFIGHNQYHRAYCLFVSKIHASELHELNNEFKKQFLIEMALVEEVIYEAVKPKKMNIELLGNTHSHLHWHILPRQKNDPFPKIPVWNNPSFLINKARLSKSELQSLKNMLLKSFDRALNRKGL